MHSWPGGDEAGGVVRCHERGLPALGVENEHGRMLVFLQGAQVAQYQPPGGAGVLFVSSKSRFEPGVPIRGGIPLCFPWFGAHPEPDSGKPAHGFARNREFRYLGSRQSAAGTTLAFELAANDATRALWPFDFRARLTATLGATLSIEFEVENRDAQSFSFEEALHSYFAIGDVSRAQVEGLGGARYADKVSGAELVQAGASLAIDGETDRVYTSDAQCRLLDPVLGRCIEVKKSASATTIVWNPWIDKARRMSDFDDDEYRNMLCIESANTAGARVELASGAAHRITLEVAVS